VREKGIDVTEGARVRERKGLRRERTGEKRQALAHLSPSFFFFSFSLLLSLAGTEKLKG